MNAGLPGTGLGGLFYIAGALLMPLHRLRRGGGHSGRTWRRALAQAGIALGILSTLVATGWVLGLLIAPDAAALTAAGRTPAASIPVVRLVAVLGTVGLLALVLLVVEVWGLALARRSRRAKADPTVEAPERIAAGAGAARDDGAGPDEDLPRVA